MIQEELKEILLETMPLAGPASGGRFVVFRCPYCPDGKNPTSKHFYVGLGYDNSLPFFYCHLCHSTGIVTPEVLSEWGVYDIELGINLKLYNKKIYSLPQNKDKDKEIYKLNNTFISDNDLSRAKLKYINSRIGQDLSYKDLLDLKIILNLYDLLDKNNITEYTRDKNIMDELDRSFIGFISADNAFINMRNLRVGKVYKSIDKRYINYNIFNKLNNTNRFYSIPNTINLNNPNPIQLHLAEGPFDILSIYFNLRKTLDHNIYSAVCGSGYKNIIKHYINKLKLINIEIHIYKDNDIDNYIINDVCNIIRPFFIPIYLHSNVSKGEKDFGVTIDRIEEKIERVI